MEGWHVALGVVIGLVLGAMFGLMLGGLCAANGEDAAVATRPASDGPTGRSTR
jgi:hypothetical protein